ncbi:MAG: cytochrome d ubiquinol oxidase subunit II [Alicyclobacillus sp.]|nr:cytochrome d ubiquinol oxidase subunit II [Alicyclobacillus sp.]
MDLNTLWFLIIAWLFTGFFVLEGFDFGVGMLLPWLGRTDDERRVILNTIGPFWDANEVWFISAGASLFAAFPNWYATLFSGFYLALFFLLVALIGRGVAFEFRSKLTSPAWRQAWDWVIFGGSLLPPLLWGVALANMMRGVPIDASMNYVGTFWDLLSVYALLGGVSVTLLFLLHGALFLTLRTADQVQARARKVALGIGAWTTAVTFLFVVLSYIETDMFSKLGIDPGTVPLLAGLALFSVQFFIRARRDGWAFAMTSLTIVLSTATVFIDLYPRVMVSSLRPEWSLTVYNTAANPYSLQVMTWIALTVLPLVLLYQGWSYWVFRRRIRLTDPHEY